VITPDMADIILDAIDSKLIDLHTAMPGKVQSFNSTTHTAEIEPQIKRMIQSETGQPYYESLPVLPAVPVLFLRTKDFYLYLPVSEGDTGLLVFNETSIDQWRDRGSVSNPCDTGRHTLTAAVFIPGLFSSGNELTDAAGSGLKLGEQGKGFIEIKSGGQVNINNNLTVDK